MFHYNFCLIFEWILFSAGLHSKELPATQCNYWEKYSWGRKIIFRYQLLSIQLLNKLMQLINQVFICIRNICACFVLLMIRASNGKLKCLQVCSQVDGKIWFILSTPNWATSNNLKPNALHCCCREFMDLLHRGWRMHLHHDFYLLLSNLYGYSSHPESDSGWHTNNPIKTVNKWENIS